tara:strand:- start:1317 stop:1859 length:543 start_codon:yes stop_codon:yes gene_type:complete
VNEPSNTVRRRVLTRIVQGFAAVGGVFLMVPFVKTFLPRADVPLQDVNLGDLRPGDVRYVDFLGRRVVILGRSPETVRALQDAPERLKDPESSNSMQPGFAANARRSRRDEFFLAYANCTHLGCEIAPEASGFRCPCHSSRFDAAGRAHADAAAPRNLDIPNYRFLSRDVVRLLPDGRTA